MAVTVTDSQRIRVALAFVALRYKPKGVSLDAYVLDLRRQFPLDKTQEGASDEPWRDRALRLEEEVKDLKRKYEEDLVELGALRESTRPEAPGKKKRKPNPAHERVDSNIASLAPSVQNTPGTSTCLRTEISSLELGGALDLFNSYNKLFQLSSALRSQPGPSDGTAQLLSSATNVLRALGKVLHDSLSPKSPLKISSNLAADFDVILSSTLSCTASVLHEIDSSARKRTRVTALPDGQLDALFSALSGDIVLPIINSFSRLSEAALTPVLSSTRSQRSGEESGIPSITSILQGFVGILGGIIGTVSKIRNSHSQKLLCVMKLSVIAEIERLWTESGGITAAAEDSLPSGTAPCLRPVTRLSRTERTQRLARKDALWYLCSIARELFSSSSPTRESGGPSCDIAREKFDVTLSRILVRCTTSISASEMDARNSSIMSDVEKALIASVIERIWLSQ